MVRSSLSCFSPYQTSILTIHSGVRDVHIHDRLVEAAPAQVPLPELDDDDLMMDEGLDEQDDLKDDAHAPA